MPGVGPLMCFQKLSRWLEAHSSLRSTLSGLDRAYSWISLSWAIELLSQMWVNLICSHFKNQYFTHFCNWLQSPNVLGLMIFRRGDWTSPAQQAVIAPQVSICVPCHVSPPPPRPPAPQTGAVTHRIFIQKVICPQLRIWSSGSHPCCTLKSLREL